MHAILRRKAAVITIYLQVKRFIFSNKSGQKGKPNQCKFDLLSLLFKRKEIRSEWPDQFVKDNCLEINFKREC